MPKVILEDSRYFVLGPLIRQLRFSSPSTLLGQTYRAERLITLIDPAKQYPYDFVCFKLTDFKPKEISTPYLLPGDKISSDLATFIEQVTRQVPLTFEQLAEPGVLTCELAKEVGISPKTLKRWALKFGLAQRYVVGPEGTAQTCILKNTWQWFISRHEKLVAKAAAFSRLTADQRQSIVNQARKMYKTGRLSRHQVEVALAEKNHRARETIRYILTHHDADAAPEFRVFPARTKLTPETIGQIFEMYQRGIGIDQLAAIFARSESSIYRIIHESRQAFWREAQIEYIYSPEFDLPSAQQTISPAMQIQLETQPESTHTQTLTGVQERELFRVYNYLKWKQDQLRKPLISAENSVFPAAVLDQLDSFQHDIDQLKAKLILANQALVISIAKRHLNSSLTLDELVSEGLTPLLKAVEKFDYTRGFKFSTYASWAIMKHFARVVPLADQHRHDLVSDEKLDALLPQAGEVDEAESFKRSQAVQSALDHLDDRERAILENRYGLNRLEDPLSLAQLGQRLGITKERVRQIESKAMDKLHEVLKETLPS